MPNVPNETMRCVRAAQSAISTQNVNPASRRAPRRSPRWRRRFPAASNASVTMITARTVASTVNVTVNTVELEAPGVRSGLVHGSISVKNTDCPRSAAASARCSRGELLVHAMRTSDAASEVHSGSAGWNLDWSSPAAANRALQSVGGVSLLGVCNCAGIRSK